MFNWLAGKYTFKVKNLDSLTAKEKASLLRIYYGKDAEKILTPAQFRKAKDIVNGSNSTS